jgi:hypothetical protein
MSEAASTKCRTPVGIVSYPNLFVPKASDDEPNGKKKYSVALILDEKAQATPEYKAMQQAAIAAADKKFPGQGLAKLLAGVDGGGLRSPFRKDGEKKGYGKGVVFVNLRSDNRPGVVTQRPGPDGKTPMDISEADANVVGGIDSVYPGMLGRATVSAFYYKRSGNEGISFGLNNFQKMGDGKRIDSRKKGTDDFDADLSAPTADLAVGDAPKASAPDINSVL